MSEERKKRQRRTFGDKISILLKQIAESKAWTAELERRLEAEVSAKKAALEAESKAVEAAIKGTE